MLNPMDFLLWVSEELETRDWDSKALGTKLGLAFNFIFLIARANCAASEAHDDVFSDGVSSRLTNYVVRSERFHSFKKLRLTLNRSDLSPGSLFSYRAPTPFTQ